MQAGKWIFYSSCAIALCGVDGAYAQDAAQEAGTASAATADIATQDIVVTARRRSETLNNVPVVVSVVGSAAITRNNANDLTKIAELTPTVIVGAYKSNGGGSIAIRGISSPANQAGFEQAVSVAIDGVQTSDGRIAQLGFFDIDQVEVLKGPQALLFGKNNTAGVISIKTADPADHVELVARQSYEFVGDESTTDAALSVPLGDNWGARLAVRYRYLDGWLRNTAGSIANPFYNPATGAPAGAAQLPGTATRRPGDSELLGRLTLKGEIAPDVTARLKVFGARGRDDGPGVATQNIGPCTGANPRMYGVADPNAECKVDNRTTVGDLPPAIAATMHNANQTGKAFGRLSAFVTSLDLEAKFGQLALNSTTGYSYLRYHFLSGLDQTTYSQLAFTNIQRNRAISEELRLTSDFSGPFNFMAGLYYQSTLLRDTNDTKLNDGSYNAAANRFVTYEDLSRQTGRTLSGFAQGLFKVSDTIELAGGARYTQERKRLNKRNLYGIGSFNNLTTIYPGSDEPGVLKGRFKDSNVSPEATLTWRPETNRTLFIAYRTGFKSGGFAVTNPFQTTTRIGDFDFESEKAKGFEAGAKGLFLDNRLRLSAAVFRYRFSNLQVNTYDPARIAYTINNAGRVKQHGAELEANFRASSIVSLHGAVAWVHNRFSDFVGQCYGYAFPTGTTRATAVAPPNCSFVNATALTLQQDFGGRAPARAPEWSGNAGFEINLPLGDKRIGLSGDAFYSDGYYAAETMAPSTYQKSLWRLNASASLGADDDRWRVSLVGRNLTNKYYLLYAADRTGGTGVPGAIGEQRGVVARGRELALQLSVKL